MKKTKIKEIEKKIAFKDIKVTLIIAILIFLVSIFFGYINADYLSLVITPLLEDIVNKTSGLQGIELAVYIFTNNALTSLAAILTGIALGIFPLITTISNGVILGFVLERTAQIAGISEWWRLLPHGIFELPAVFISIALGLKLGFMPIKNYLVFYRSNNKNLFYLPFIISILLIIFSIIAAISDISQTRQLFFQNIELPSGLIISALALFFTVFYFALSFAFFLIVTIFIDKKLRMIQIIKIKEGLYGAVSIFTFIVIPLLIVAAIIETLLIIFV